MDILTIFLRKSFEWIIVNLRRRSLTSEVIFTDETTIQMNLFQKEKKEYLPDFPSRFK